MAYQFERHFSLAVPEHIFLKKALYWAFDFSTYCCLNSNNYTQDAYGKYDLLLGVGAKHVLRCSTGNAFDNLTAFRQQHPEQFMFGYFGYDLKNELEQLHSDNPDRIEFDDLYFFIPEIVLLKKKDTIIVLADEEINDSFLEQIIQSHRDDSTNEFSPVNIQHSISKEKYMATVEQLKQHIVDGTIYEINFCQEFYAEKLNINPLHLFLKYNGLAQSPFSAFLKIDNKYALCQSPERFLQKTGDTVIAQPMKGTCRRSDNIDEDEQLKIELRNNLKEQAENVMIVDLMRNDLARTSTDIVVTVPELFGIYSFRTVHQLISTVEAKYKKCNGIEVIKNAFPMGSMTGAPKISAMKLIDKYESTRRGLFSGALGYFTPDDDFDFNVVIRTIMYRVDSGYLSMQTGGAITYDSVAENEYHESLLKAKSLFSIFN